MQKYINTGMKHINTGTPVRLKTLIVSGDVQDDTKITIFNKDGAFLTAGNWYQDQVLNYIDKVGIAKKAGTGLTVSFRIL